MIFAEVASASPWWIAIVITGISACGAACGGVAAFVVAARRLRTDHEDVICTRLKRVFETFHNGMMVVDRNLIVLMANKQARAITGYGSDLVGKSIYDLIPQEFREKHRDHVQRFFNDPHTRRMGGNQKFPMIDRFGQKKDLRISLSPSCLRRCAATAAYRAFVDGNHASA